MSNTNKVGRITLSGNVVEDIQNMLHLLPKDEIRKERILHIFKKIAQLKVAKKQHLLKLSQLERQEIKALDEINLLIGD